MRNRISEFRKNLGLTKAEVARRVGTSPQHYGDLESGKKTLNQRWILKISEVLEVAPADLISDPLRTPDPSRASGDIERLDEDIFARLGMEIVRIYAENNASIKEEDKFRELAKRYSLLETNLKTMDFETAFQATLNAIELDARRLSAKAG